MFGIKSPQVRSALWFVLVLSVALSVGTSYFRIQRMEARFQADLLVLEMHTDALENVATEVAGVAVALEARISEVERLQGIAFEFDLSVEESLPDLSERLEIVELEFRSPIVVSRNPPSWVDLTWTTDTELLVVSSEGSFKVETLDLSSEFFLVDGRATRRGTLISFGREYLAMTVDWDGTIRFYTVPTDFSLGELLPGGVAISACSRNRRVCRPYTVNGITFLQGIGLSD